jgi:hypothetical protein
VSFHQVIKMIFADKKVAGRKETTATQFGVIDGAAQIPTD